MVDKVKQGKKNRASGADFERRTRADLNDKGWTVDKWSNNVEQLHLSSGECSCPHNSQGCSGTGWILLSERPILICKKCLESNVIWDNSGKYPKAKGHKCIQAKLVPAKRKYAGPGRPMVIGTGFPDFISFRKDEDYSSYTDDYGDSYPNTLYEVIGVECKTNGALDKVERQKCRWLLNNNIFSKILISSKSKVKNKIVITYTDFEEKYGVVTRK